MALLADAAGAARTVPTPGRTDATRRYGCEEALRTRALLRGTGTRVLVVSIGDAGQLTDLAAVAVDAPAVGAEVAEQSLHDPPPDAAVAGFARARRR